MLVFHRNAKRGTGKEKATGIDRYCPAQRYQRNRCSRRKPYSHEILTGFMHSDQEENQRVRDEGGIFPERIESFLSPVREHVERLEIGHDEPGCDRRQDAREAEMISQQEG